MKTKKGIKDWLLENCIDKDGDLNLNGLDFSDFDGNIWINDLKVKGDLLQSSQKVKGSLYQNFQQVQGSLFQYGQEVQSNFKTQTLKDDEEYKINEYEYTYIVKKTKKHTLEELRKILGYDFEIVEKEDKENE